MMSPYFKYTVFLIVCCLFMTPGYAGKEGQSGDMTIVDITETAYKFHVPSIELEAIHGKVESYHAKWTACRLAESVFSFGLGCGVLNTLRRPGNFRSKVVTGLTSVVFFSMACSTPTSNLYARYDQKNLTRWVAPNLSRFHRFNIIPVENRERWTKETTVFTHHLNSYVWDAYKRRNHLEQELAKSRVNSDICAYRQGNDPYVHALEALRIIKENPGFKELQECLEIVRALRVLPENNKDLSDCLREAEDDLSLSLKTGSFDSLVIYCPWRIASRLEDIIDGPCEEAEGG